MEFLPKPGSLRGDPVIYVCSPYAGDPEGNSKRAMEYSRAVWECGGIPLAPHLLFPRFMDDDNPDEREAGLRMARKLLTMCDEVWVFGGRITAGMEAEIKEATAQKIPVHYINQWTRTATPTGTKEGGHHNGKETR